MSELQVDIISPEKPLYSGAAQEVVARAWDGEIGILPGHAPLITRLGIGEVRITRGGQGARSVDRFAISYGYLQVAENRVVVLTEKANAVHDAAWVKADEIALVEKELAETTDLHKRAELAERLEWMRACEKLQAKVS